MNYLKPILQNLKEHESQLNSINVFPIADKDTGTNLYKTLNVEVKSDTFKDFLFKLSDKILYSARGSSGNILALYVLGLKENYNENLSLMCKKAAQFTWDTVYEPREGTMLTAFKAVPSQYTSLLNFLEQYYHNMIDCLLKGPDLLPVLKERNTLDSGTLGIIYILEGLYETLKEENSSSLSLSLALTPVNAVVREEEYTYCVEILLQGIHKEKLECLQEYGDELIILNTSGNTKLHIHTNQPSEIVKKVEEISHMLHVKIDNMKTGETFTS